MASAIKSTLSSAVSSVSGSHGETGNESSKNDPSHYRLKIAAGPNYDKALQKPVAVNGTTSTIVSSSVSVAVRIKDYNGFPSSSPSTHPYFDVPNHSKSSFSIAFSFTPRGRDVPAHDLWWGIDTGHNPIRKFGLSKGIVNTAFKVVKEFVDPSLQCDVSADEPWVMGPVLAGSTMEWEVGPKVDEGGAIPPAPSANGINKGNIRVIPAPNEHMTEGARGSGAQVRSSLSIPDTSDKRRKFFHSNTTPSSPSTPSPASSIFEKNRSYGFDFANGYIDWKNYALKLPGFSLSVLKYVGSKSHRVRFVLQDKKTGEVFLVVMCTLLAGEDLEAEVRAERGAVKRVEGQAGGGAQRGNGFAK